MKFFFLSIHLYFRLSFMSSSFERKIFEKQINERRCECEFFETKQRPEESVFQKQSIECFILKLGMCHVTCTIQVSMDNVEYRLVNWLHQCCTQVYGNQFIHLFANLFKTKCLSTVSKNVE